MGQDMVDTSSMPTSVSGSSVRGATASNVDENASPLDGFEYMELLSFAEWKGAVELDALSFHLNVRGHSELFPLARQAEDFQSLTCAVTRDVFGVGRAAAEAREWWMSRTPWLDGAQIRMAGVGMRWLDLTTVEAGTIILTDADLHFVPAGDELTGETVITVPRAQITPADEVEHDECQLVVLEGSEPSIITPSDGPEFVMGVVRELRETRGSDEALEMEPGQPITALIGEHPFLRVLSPLTGECIAQLDGAQIVPIDEYMFRFGLIFPGTPARAFQQRSSVRFELGRWDGVYLFDADVIGVERAPQFVREHMGPGCFMVVFARPKDIARYNRRGAFRVVLDEPRRTRVLLSRDGWSWSNPVDVLMGQVVDFSTSGCAIRTNRHIPVGTRVAVDVPLSNGMLITTAEIRNSVPPEEEGEGWRHGAHFLGLSDDEKRLLLDEVMFAQRDTLRRIAERRVDFDGSA
jgi:hypothetical protein